MAGLVGVFVAVADDEDSWLFLGWLYYFWLIQVFVWAPDASRSW